MKSRRDSEHTRCVTPTTSDDEIPHLMNPSSDTEDDPDSDEPELMSNIPDSSTISTISSYTRVEKSLDVVPAATTGAKKMASLVSICSDDGSASANSRASSKASSRASSRSSSMRRRRNVPPSPPTISILKEPSFCSTTHTESISPLTTRCVTPVQNFGKTRVSSPILHAPTNSSSSDQAMRSSRGRESPLSFSSRPPPAPSLVHPHRRSTSLNSHYSTSRRKYDELKMSTLKEGTQSGVENELMPITYTTRMANCNAVLGLKHRRAVSFPDEVPPDCRNQLYPYDFTLESDDPALFSLVPTTQARRDGRVFIAQDTFLASPAAAHLHPVWQDSISNSTSSSLQLPKTKESKSRKSKRDRARRQSRSQNGGDTKTQKKQLGFQTDHGDYSNAAPVLVNGKRVNNTGGLKPTLETSSIEIATPRTNNRSAYVRKVRDHKIESPKKKGDKAKHYHCVIQ